MAYQDLHAFLVAASKHKSLRDTIKKGGKDADALMTEAGLNAQEMALVKSRDKAKIKEYLGDRYAAAVKVNVYD